MAPPRPVAVAERVSPEPDQLPPALGAKATPLLGGSHGIAQEPVDVLKTNGLVKSGKFFVLPEEEKVLQGLFNMRPFMGQLEAKYNAWGAILQNEAEFQQLGDYKIQVTGQLNDFRILFNNMPQRTPLERFQKQQASQQFAVFDNELRLTNSEARSSSKATCR